MQASGWAAAILASAGIHDALVLYTRRAKLLGKAMQGRTFMVPRTPRSCAIRILIISLTSLPAWEHMQLRTERGDDHPRYVSCGEDIHAVRSTMTPIQVSAAK